MRSNRFIIGVGIALVLIALVGFVGFAFSSQGNPPETAAVTPGRPTATPPIIKQVTLPATEGNGQHLLYVFPEDTSQPIIDFINSAKSSLAIKLYLLTDRDIIAALINTPKRGVKTRIILEKNPVGEGGSNEQNFTNLKAAGAEVQWGNPDFKLTHEKSIIVDNRAAAIMTANMTRASFTKNREYAIITTNANEVKEVKAGFEADWGHTKFAPPANSSLVWSNNNARSRIFSFIDSAKKTLDIEQQYVLDKETQQKLIEAAKRGVQVRLVVPSPQGTNNMEWATYLSKNGVQVRVIADLYMHAKLYVADGKTVLVGSINASQQSIEQNRELDIQLSDVGIVARIGTTFDKDWKVSKPF